MKIAFLGTGLMGLPMAANLIRKGHTLIVWNRTSAKARPLIEIGGSVGSTPAACIAESDLTITVLENGAAVEQVVFDSRAAKQLKPGSLFIDMSSIAPEIARRHAAWLAEENVGYVDAPVSGGPYGARDATLAIMAGGSEADYARALPILTALGNPTRVGPIGCGQLAKLGSQVIVAAAIAAVSEAMLLVRAGGANPEKLPAAFHGGLSDSKVLQIHGGRMVKRNFVPGGHVRTHCKDLGAAIDEAARRKLNLPLTKYLHGLLLQMCTNGLGDCDHSAILLDLERMNPLHRLGDGPDQRPQ
jgi:2-hydroxy-3-oxopropionate reductase